MLKRNSCQDDDGAWLPTPEEIEQAKAVEWQKHLEKKRNEGVRGYPKRLPRTVPRLNGGRGLREE